MVLRKGNLRPGSLSPPLCCREACLAMRERFPEANRRKIRQAYAIMWQL